LEAAQQAGGDIRGRGGQSAALIVVSGEPTGTRWIDRRFDLRIEDHPTPVAELRRLVTLQRAFLKLNEGDGWVTEGDLERAMEANWAELLVRLPAAELLPSLRLAEELAEAMRGG